MTATPRADVGLRRARKRSLTDDITDQVATLITEGTLKVGERLPAERELCHRFGVSRMVVREAIKALSVMGLVEVRHGAGIYVSNSAVEGPLRQMLWNLRFGPLEARELFTIRRLLEEEAARLAAGRVAQGEAQAAGLDAALRDMRALVDDKAGFARADVDFHVALAEMSGNGILARLTRVIRELLIQYVQASGPRVESALRHHQRIRDTVADGDEEAARRAMAEHLDQAAIGTMGLLLEGQDPGAKRKRRASTTSHRGAVPNPGRSGT